MEAVSTSETPLYFYQTTRCNIPEDSHLQKLQKIGLYLSKYKEKWKRSVKKYEE
jgi:hypothetical protein